MFELTYTPSFIKKYESLETSLQSEVAEKIVLLKDRGNHKILKVHKLHGRLSGCYSFSVNYKFRVVFEYARAKEIICHSIGDHDLYK